jgi:hypothetical protein
MVATDPTEEYAARLAKARKQAAIHDRQHVRIGNIRLIGFILGVFMAWASFFQHRIPPALIIAPLLVFLLLAFIDDSALRRKRAAERRAQYYERGQARLENRWQGLGPPSDHLLDKTHPYARDFDIFGRGGLFELISLARTEPGEKLLAEWLLKPAAIEEIRRRHSAIDELRGKLDFREALAVTGEKALSEKETAPLSRWGEAPPSHVTTLMRFTALFLSIAMAAILAWFGIADFLWLARPQQSRPPLAAYRLLLVNAALTGLFGLRWKRRVEKAVDDFEKIRPGIALLSDLLREIEETKWEGTALREMQARLKTDVTPSKQVGKLNRYADLLDSRETLLLRLLGRPLLWTTQVAFAIERWRECHGRQTRIWLETVSEMEALSSLATYAYEHPRDPFPEIIDGAAVFMGEGLRHPLLPNCVANDCSLDAKIRLLIVSGSNMSGKSTLLRTVGVNAVLALCGAPVSAQQLRISHLRIGASLQVGDSLIEGVSHFSAEIAKIRQITSLADGAGSALFLIDEILEGTNSHDRLVGSEAILRRLIEGGAAGLVTTHDLALTRIVDGLDGRAANIHFRDEIRDGHMVFDYRVHSGVVQASNAIQLMRLYGLL